MTIQELVQRAIRHSVEITIRPDSPRPGVLSVIFDRFREDTVRLCAQVCIGNLEIFSAKNTTQVDLRIEEVFLKFEQVAD